VGEPRSQSLETIQVIMKAQHPQSGSGARLGNNGPISGSRSIVDGINATARAELPAGSTG